MRAPASEAMFSACAMLLALPALAASDPDRQAADTAQWLMPVAALATTYWRDDREGRWQFFESLGTTVVATEALKKAFNSTSWGRRPNGGENSFPSGHTSSTCGAGFFLQRRYGWALGAPALGVAAFTGYTRVDERAHHWRDVIAGCALAWGSARYFVDRQRSGQLELQPELGARSASMSFRWRY